MITEPTQPPVDPTSVNGLRPTVDEDVDVLVVGAGIAGCTAAIEAARVGLSVVLVDENPVDAEAMGNEIPVHFGNRMTGAVRNRNAMMEAVLEASPLLVEAFEAGVDVRLSTACWGVFTAAPTAAWVDRPIAGLVDSGGVKHLGFTSVVFATGTRDMGLAFPGWDLPGVMGAVAARRLATTYGALDAERAVVVGSGTEALLAALDLAKSGVAVVAVVEAASASPASADLIAQIAGLGIEVLTDSVIARAKGDAGGVIEVTVARVNAEGRQDPASERPLACDTVVLGIAAVPVIDLLEAAGCRTVFDPTRGGHVPVIDGRQTTTLAGHYAVGDVAGLWSEKSTDPEIAKAEARRAVSAILKTENAGEALATPEPAGPDRGDLDGYLKHWVRSTVVAAAGEPFLCQCEDVTARDVLGVRPPKYLGWEPATQKPSDLASLLGNGPPNPDQVKRLTRAGMGQCQGRRCREQVAVLLALETGRPLGEIALATYRAPVRPIALAQFSETAEVPEMSAHWQAWFGIPSMWLAPWDLGPGGTLPEDVDG
ncbi:MAG: FAD-dependent oxidoreductase [Thalassobaculaceae bacterium]|nr:FAD-dependent oxidoreductase [Thalassobaculaceae bacterium]